MKSIRRILRLLPFVSLLLLTTCAVLAWLAKIDWNVEAMGEVNVERFEVVRPRIDGLITEVLVRTGEEVRAGQVLLELDDRDMEEEIASLTSEAAETRAAFEGARLRREILTGSIHPREAENQRNALALKSLQTQRQAARVEELKTGAEAAQGRFERMQALDKDGLISRETLEQARLEMLQAKWRLRQSELEENERETELDSSRNERTLLAASQQHALAEVGTTLLEFEQRSARLTARLEELKRLRELRRLQAGLGGIVVAPPPPRLLHRKVAAGDEILTIMDPQSISFIALVPEEAIVKIRPGQPALVELKALPRRKFGLFKGTVEEVAQAPEEGRGDPQVVYPVRIRLNRPWVQRDRQRMYFRSGMQGSAKIAYAGEIRLIRALFDFLTGDPSI